MNDPFSSYKYLIGRNTFEIRVTDGDTGDTGIFCISRKECEERYPYLPLLDAIKKVAEGRFTSWRNGFNRSEEV